MRKMSNKKQRTTLEIEISPAFLIIFIVTVVLLISLVVGLFVVMNRDKGPVVGGSNPGGGKTPGGGDLPVGDTVKTPLYPTVETRSSYLITTPSGIDMAPDITSNTVLVKLSAGALTSVVEKNAGEKIYPASMTKVMTLLVACERVTDLDAMLTITEDHIAYYKAYCQDGSTIFDIWGDPDLPGERISVKNALYLISYESDTIACMLIAEHIAGSQEEFVKLMNQKVTSLGLTGTNFVNCTGLHTENHYSTCKDMASIAAYALDNELAKTILLSTTDASFKSDKFYTAKDPTKKVTYYVTAPGWYKDRFDKNAQLDTVTLIGGKTGWEPNLVTSLLTVAKASDGTLYINVVANKIGSYVNIANSTKDVKHIYNTYVN